MTHKVWTRGGGLAELCLRAPAGGTGDAVVRVGWGITVFLEGTRRGWVWVSTGALEVPVGDMDGCSQGAV